MTVAKPDCRTYFSNTAWNMSSFAVQALCGAVINFALVYFVGAKGLGVFNQLYAVFMISGQLFAFGLHDSAQKHFAVPTELRGKDQCKKEDFWALFLSVIATGLFGFFILLLSPYFLKNLIKSQEVLQGLRLLAFGLPFFTINKVLLGILNGESQMKHFAIIQIIRVLLITVSSLAIPFGNYSFSSFAIAFIISEVVVSLLLIPPMIRHYRFPTKWERFGDKIKYHLIFGLKSLPHGFLVETFIRVDILVLSLFMSDEKIGIYSFVAFFFEGIFQVPYLIRTVTNPLLVPVIMTKDRLALGQIFKRSLLTSGFLTCVISLVCILLFPFILSFFPDMPADLAYPALKILLVGLMIHSFLSPFDNFLLLGGKPGLQSLYMILIAGINVLLNFLLIPRLELLGAALATASSFALCGPVILILSFYTFEIGSWKKL